MLDDWFHTIKLPLSGRQFHQLPQNPAYRYEYLEKSAWLSPRPKFYSVRLPLGQRDEYAARDVNVRGPIDFRGLEDATGPDWRAFSPGRFTACSRSRA